MSVWPSDNLVSKVTEGKLGKLETHPSVTKRQRSRNTTKRETPLHKDKWPKIILGSKGCEENNATWIINTCKVSSF